MSYHSQATYNRPVENEFPLTDKSGPHRSGSLNTKFQEGGNAREPVFEPDSLEREQSGQLEHTRSASQGEDAHLTELAAPSPVSERERRDSLELEQRKASHSFSHSTDRNVFLSELAAPPPIHEEEGDDDGKENEDEKQEDTNLASPVSNSNSEEDVSPAFVTDEEKPQSPTVTSTEWKWTETVTVGWLSFFSILGTLARLGVEAIGKYPYAPVPSTVMWANVGGSLFLGFLLEDRRLFQYSTDSPLPAEDESQAGEQFEKAKKVLPLYIGLATGFCGSFTSYSSFITDVFLALSNNLPPPSQTTPYHSVPASSIRPRNGGYSFMAALGILILHPAVSIAALKTGAHVAIGVKHVLPRLPPRLVSRYLDVLAIPLGFGCWIGSVLLCIWPVTPDWRRRAVVALAFSPPGALLRFYVSRQLNAHVPAFPMGTFLVNVFGTCVEGMCYDLQHSRQVVRPLRPETSASCAVLEGVMQGFCGCITTVSTWVAELNGLRRKHGWIYGFTSVGVALGFQIAIMGSVAWTNGFDSSCEV